MENDRTVKIKKVSANCVGKLFQNKMLWLAECQWRENVGLTNARSLMKRIDEGIDLFSKESLIKDWKTCEVYFNNRRYKCFADLVKHQIRNYKGFTQKVWLEVKVNWQEAGLIKRLTDEDWESEQVIINPLQFVVVNQKGRFVIHAKINSIQKTRDSRLSSIKEVIAMLKASDDGQVIVADLESAYR